MTSTVQHFYEWSRKLSDVRGEHTTEFQIGRKSTISCQHHGTDLAAFQRVSILR